MLYDTLDREDERKRMKRVNKKHTLTKVGPRAEHEKALATLKLRHAALNKQHIHEVNILKKELTKGVTTTTSDVERLKKRNKRQRNRKNRSIHRKELQDRLDKLENNGVQDHLECIVCMNNEPAYIITPCGHQCVCVICKDTISSCPMCRGKLESIIKVFI